MTGEGGEFGNIASDHDFPNCNNLLSQ